MFRDQTKTADDILAAMSDDQLRAGLKRGLLQIKVIEAQVELDDDNAIGNPNDEMAPTRAGRAALYQMDYAMARPYRQAVADVKNEMRRRGIQP